MSFIDNLFSVKEKIILITGTSRGIGLALAEAFYKAGAIVIGCSRKEPENRTIFSRYYLVDLSDEQLMSECLEKIVIEYPQIDVLINAAGTTIDHKGGIDLAESSRIFDETINVNLKAAFLCIQKLQKNICDNIGSVINITSIGQDTGFPNNPSYLASKGGLAQLSKGFAYDLASRGIRVNNIAPGYIHTSMTKKSFNDPELHNIRKRNMLLNRWGNPEDIAGAAIYLASSASSYVTGSTIYVDGGWLAKGLV